MNNFHDDQTLYNPTKDIFTKPFPLEKFKKCYLIYYLIILRSIYYLINAVYIF